MLQLRVRILEFALTGIAKGQVEDPVYYAQEALETAAVQGRPLDA